MCVPQGRGDMARGCGGAPVGAAVGGCHPGLSCINSRAENISKRVQVMLTEAPKPQGQRQSLEQAATPRSAGSLGK